MTKHMLLAFWFLYNLIKRIEELKMELNFFSISKFSVVISTAWKATKHLKYLKSKRKWTFKTRWMKRKRLERVWPKESEKEMQLDANPKKGSRIRREKRLLNKCQNTRIDLIFAINRSLTNDGLKPRGWNTMLLYHRRTCFVLAEDTFWFLNAIIRTIHGSYGNFLRMLVENRSSPETDLVHSKLM